MDQPPIPTPAVGATQATTPTDQPEDAEALAGRWGQPADVVETKAEAGRVLQAGVALADGPRADPTLDDAYSEQSVRDVFYDAGYTQSNALTLARQWGTGLEEAARRAGSELLVVGALPFVDPTPTPGA